MQTSVLVAKIASVIYLSASLGGFVSKDFYRRIVDDLYTNAALTYMIGFVAVIAGGLIVHFHNVWAGNWTVLVTLIGWAALIKGVFLIAFPQFMRRFSEPFLSETALRIVPFVTLALGLLFGYFAFFRCC